MLNIEINGEQRSIPTKHNELPLSKFCEIWKVLRKYDVDKADLDREMSDEQIEEGITQEFDLTTELVAVLLDISIEDAKAVDFGVAMQITDIFNNDMLNEKHEDDMQGVSFKVGEELFYYPSLELNDLTFGEYAEMKQCEQILGKDVGNRFDYIPRQMALLCKKKNEKKGDYDVSKREELFKTITTDKALMFAFFLLKWTNNLHSNIQTYMDSQEEFIAKLPILSMDTVGLTKFMTSLKMAYLPKEA